MTKIPNSYKKARKYLNYTQQQAAKKAGLTDSVITKIEKGQVDSPNHKYTTFLIEQGINPYFLIGASDEIEGVLVEAVTKSAYEALQADYENLKLEKENLEEQVSEMVSRSEFEEVVQENRTLQKVLKMLKIDR